MLQSSHKAILRKPKSLWRHLLLAKENLRSIQKDKMVCNRRCDILHSLSLCSIKTLQKHFICCILDGGDIIINNNIIKKIISINLVKFED